MIRPATLQDTPAIEAVALQGVEQAMFLLASLRKFGPLGGPHPRALRVWVVGNVEGAFGLSTSGYLSFHLPQGVPPGLRKTLRGEGILGIAGPDATVAAICEALALRLPPSLDAAEPQFRLALAELRLPQTTATLRRPTEADFPLLHRWRQDYSVEILGATHGPALAAQAADNLRDWIAEDRLRLLTRDGTPVAMTGFNATLPEIVQIGGVYTPPALRGQGLARAAVGLHLAEARETGVVRAVLAAASDHAARAYQSLGFTRFSTFRVTSWAEPQVVT